MKSLIKLAMGAAVAGALVNMLMKQRSGKAVAGRGETPETAGPDSSYDENAGRGAAGFTVDELVADSPDAAELRAPNTFNS